MAGYTIHYSGMYRYNPIFESEFPYRRYFQKNDVLGNRTHQIHLVNYPAACWEKKYFI